MKVLIVIALVGILAALASAGAFMLRRRPPADEGAEPDLLMAQALPVRVRTSVALFLFVLLSWSLGWVRPGGLPVGG